MGNLCGLCFGANLDDNDLIMPNGEIQRRQIAEAAEQRICGQQNKGIKNPEIVKRMQQKAAELERLEREQAMAGRNGPVLRWTQG